MEIRGRQVDTFLIAAALLSILYFSYWAFVYNYRFETYQNAFYDIGIETYSMYWHLHAVAYANPLEFLVFADHITPFYLLILPLFSLSENAMTLIVIQDMFLALTATAVYLVAKGLTRNRWMGFGFFVLFLLSTGMRGLAVFDFHMEAFVPLFCILAFYFYMKGRRGYFALSYVLLLGVFETACVIGLSLLLGLLAYELLYAPAGGTGMRAERQKRRGMLKLGFALTIAAVALYYITLVYVLNSYVSVPYTGVSPYLRPLSFVSDQVNSAFEQAQIYTNGIAWYIYAAIGLLILFLGFGITSMKSAIPSILLMSPWLAEIFIVHNLAFAGIAFQYYGLFAGNSLVAALLGYILMSDRPGFASKIVRFSSKTMASRIGPVIMITGLAVSLATVVYLPYSYLVPEGAQNLNYSAISSVISTIPINATVMAESSLSTHMTNVYLIELSPTQNNVSVLWYRPQYIVFDKALWDYTDFTTPSFNIYGYMAGNYTDIYNSSGLYVYRINR